MYSRLSILSFCCLCYLLLPAQNPTPAPRQSSPIAISGATAHLGNGQVIEDALITFDGGVITFVGKAGGADLSKHQIITARGKHIYPGFIATNSQLGLVEIEAVRATNDQREVGSWNPHARAAIAFNTDSQVLPTVRCRGVLYAQAVPTGGTISGQSSLLQLDGWNWEDALVLADDGVHLNWPRRQSFNWQEGGMTENKRFAEELQEIDDFLAQAKAYCNEPANPENLVLAAMCKTMNGQANLYIHADEAKDIAQAIMLANKHALKPVIVGGTESFLVTSLLKSYDVPVILGPTHALPANADDDVDQPFKTPAMLHQAGVRFCMSQEGYWQQRNLPFLTGTAVAHGLPYEAAIQAITLDAARILGIDDKIGSIEKGKAATLFISSGDALDMRSSTVERAFIDGRDVNLDNKQDQLYRKFKEKYEQGE